MNSHQPTPDVTAPDCSILTVKQVSELLDHFLDLPQVKATPEYNELNKIKLQLEVIQNKETTNLDILSTELCNNLTKWMHEPRFVSIATAHGTFDNALFSAALTLARINPINLNDFYTLEPIDQNNCVETSSRYQFNKDSLRSWLSTTNTDGKHKTTNPFTGLEFDSKDLQRTRRMLNIPNETIQHTSGDPNLSGTIEMINILTRRPSDERFVQTPATATYDDIELPPPLPFEAERQNLQAELHAHIGIYSTEAERQNLQEQIERYSASLFRSISFAYIVEMSRESQSPTANAGNRDYNEVTVNVSHRHRLAGLFHNTINEAMIQALQQWPGRLTQDHLRGWVPHEPTAVFTATHCELLSQKLSADPNLDPGDAVTSISRLSEEQARQLLQAHRGGPSPNSTLETVD